MGDPAKASQPYRPDLHPVPDFGHRRRDKPRERPLLRTMFGDHLRRVRLSQRRTLADVARAARVSLPYLSEVERGRKEASSEVLAAICDALGISLADLLIEAGTELVAWQLAAQPVLRLGLAGGGTLAGGSPGVGPDGAAISGGRGTSQATCLLAA
jgi:hypothetical protein